MGSLEMTSSLGLRATAAALDDGRRVPLACCQCRSKPATQVLTADPPACLLNNRPRPRFIFTCLLSCALGFSSAFLPTLCLCASALNQFAICNLKSAICSRPSTPSAAEIASHP